MLVQRKMDKLHVTKQMIEIKFKYQFSMKNSMYCVFFLLKYIVSMKLNFKILNILCMTPQMTIRFRGNILIGHELRNRNDAKGIQQRDKRMPSYIIKWPRNDTTEK